MIVPTEKRIEYCTIELCELPARMAIRTLRPTRENVYVTTWTDERTAPKSAPRYCKKHGMLTVRGVLDALVDLDQDEET